MVANLLGTTEVVGSNPSKGDYFSKKSEFSLTKKMLTLMWLMIYIINCTVGNYRIACKLQVKRPIVPIINQNGPKRGKNG